MPEPVETSSSHTAAHISTLVSLPGLWSLCVPQPHTHQSHITSGCPTCQVWSHYNPSNNPFLPNPMNSIHCSVFLHVTVLMLLMTSCYKVVTTAPSSVGTG